MQIQGIAGEFYRWLVAKHTNEPGRGGMAAWTITITPEAGTQKTDQAREAPLHPHLVEQGFPQFAKVNGPGLPFYNPQRRRGGLDENPQYAKVGEKLAEWVRKIGVPKGVAPNHGWRRHSTRSRGVSRLARKSATPSLDTSRGQKARPTAGTSSGT